MDLDQTVEQRLQSPVDCSLNCDLGIVSSPTT